MHRRPGLRHPDGLQHSDEALGVSDDVVRWRELFAETIVRVGGSGRRPGRLCEVASGADRFEDVLGEPVSQRMAAHLDSMTAWYLAGEPLAYVLGRWSFRRLDLAVDRRVLIPRPETEIVAEMAIELARTMPVPIIVADLGTGSGAIGLALADELPDRGVTVWLTDASLDALDVARANLAGIGRRGANVRIAHGEWFDALPVGTVLDVAVSNPPYVAVGTAELDDSVRDWEPPSALFSGDDGLDDVRRLAADARVGSVPVGGWSSRSAPIRATPSPRSWATSATPTWRSGPIWPVATASPSPAAAFLGETADGVRQRFARSLGGRGPRPVTGEAVGSVAGQPKRTAISRARWLPPGSRSRRRPHVRPRTVPCAAPVR